MGSFSFDVRQNFRKLGTSALTPDEVSISERMSLSKFGSAVSDARQVLIADCFVKPFPVYNPRTSGRRPKMLSGVAGKSKTCRAS
jgi:hypothetical protein